MYLTVFLYFFCPCRRMCVCVSVDCSYCCCLQFKYETFFSNHFIVFIYSTKGHLWRHWAFYNGKVHARCVIIGSDLVLLFHTNQLWSKVLLLPSIQSWRFERMRDDIKLLANYSKIYYIRLYNVCQVLWGHFPSTIG